MTGQNLPCFLNVHGDVANVFLQDVDLCDVVCRPDSRLKLCEGCGVAGSRHIEALGVIVDRVSTLEPQHSMLLVGQGTHVFAAQHVLHKEAALRSANKETVRQITHL